MARKRRADPEGKGAQYVAERLRAAGEAARFTMGAAPGNKPKGHVGQTRLAKIAKVPGSFLSHLLNEQRPDVPWTVASFCRVAKALDVSAESLLPPEWIEIDRVAQSKAILELAHSLDAPEAAEPAGPENDAPTEDEQHPSSRLPSPPKHPPKRR